MKTKEVLLLIILTILLTTACQSPPRPDDLWESLEDRHRDAIVERLAAGYQEIHGKCREIEFQVGSDRSTMYIRIECGDPPAVGGQSHRL